MSERTIVCRAAELPPGSRKIVQVGRKSIGVFNVKGEFYALLNHCPHQHAPLCLGQLTGTTKADCPSGKIEWIRDGEIIRCPWHAWEFDVKTGKSIFNPHRVRTASYTVEVEKPSGECESADEADPSVESFPVTVEDSLVILIT